MTAEEKKAEIKNLTTIFIERKVNEMSNKIDRVLNSGCIDIDNVDIDNYTIPKAIMAALFNEATSDYLSVKEIKEETKNISMFL